MAYTISIGIQLTWLKCSKCQCPTLNTGGCHGWNVTKDVLQRLVFRKDSKLPATEVVVESFHSKHYGQCLFIQLCVVFSACESEREA